MTISSDAVKAFDEIQHPPMKNKLNKVDIEGICCQVTAVMSDSVRPHGLQPTRLLHPWDSPGKNTGVGCHFLLQCMKVKSESEVAQSCPTLRDPTDCSPPGSSIHGIFQAKVLEWGAIAFSQSYLRDSQCKKDTLTLFCPPEINK